MSQLAQVGQGLQADEGVTIGYPTERIPGDLLVLGTDARLRSGTVVYLGSRIGDRFQTGHHVIVREECVIGDDVSLWSNSVIDYGCRIGDGVKIHSNCYVAQYTEIAEGAFLAPGVTIANDFYPGDEDSAQHMCGPSIGPWAQIGVNVTILPFVRIGARCLVGAGSVVTRDLPPGTVAYGNPATVRGSIDDLPKVASRLERIDATSRFALAGMHHTPGADQDR